MACNVAGSTGICAGVPAGENPRTASLCPKSDVASCGLDGTCNGAGACRKYVTGTVCTPGTCNGATVSGVDICDGAGRCKPGPSTSCVPYGCDAKTNACFPSCRSDTDCVSGVKCVAGSCGPKPGGAACTKNGDCASSFCADGVCCNVACKAGCVSCNQPGREGTCWPVDANRVDPHNICHDEGQASCGQTGRCDGLGSCARYAPETICVSPVCAGDRLMTAGTCNGLGTCRAPGVQTCAPYKCNAGAAACVSHCTSDADCLTGNVCLNGSCGLKPIGQSCQQGGECSSGNCIDGVCCDSLCSGACRSCALPSAMGHCTAVAVGSTDQRGICVDRGPTACGTDGRCDGGGGCRRSLRSGPRAAPSAARPGSSPPRRCAPPAGPAWRPTPWPAPRSPATAAAVHQLHCRRQLLDRERLQRQLVREEDAGGDRSDKSECASGIRAQGVCCSTDCKEACKSCALPASKGTCATSPTTPPIPPRCAGCRRPHPRDQRRSAAPAPARGTGRAPRAGTPAARVAPPRSPRPRPVTARASCVMPPAASCFPYRCDVVSSCRSTCASNADCAAPAVCNSGRCGLKAPGSSCGGNDECVSGICTEASAARRPAPAPASRARWSAASAPARR